MATISFSSLPISVFAELQNRWLLMLVLRLVESTCTRMRIIISDGHMLMPAPPIVLRSRWLS